MTILFVGSTVDELGGGLQRSTAATGRDADFTPECAFAQIESDMNSAFGIQFAQAASETWIHWYCHATAFETNVNVDGYWFALYNENGEMAQMDLDNGQMRWFAQATTADAPSWPVNTDFMVDLRIAADGTNIIYDYYVNGVLQSTLTVADTGGCPTKIIFAHDDVRYIENFRIYYSEFIITDGETTTGWRLSSLVADADGANTDWTGDYTHVTAASDGKSITTDTLNAKESWSVSTYNGPSLTSGIRAVVSALHADRGAGGPEQITPIVRIGGTDYEGTPFTPDGSLHLSVIDNDPSTEGPWASATFASMELGVKAGSPT